MPLLENPSFFPVMGAHFAVYFHGILPSPVDMAFQNISGLSASIETEAIGNGGANNSQFALPTKVSYGNLILKRGMKPFPSALSKWCENAFENFIFQPVDVIIVLLNEKHLPVFSWHIKKAIPVKYEFGELNAETSAVLLETFELKYQSFKVLL